MLGFTSDLFLCNGEYLASGHGMLMLLAPTLVLNPDFDNKSSTASSLFITTALLL